MYTVLESIGTANPPFRRSQAEAAAFMIRVQRFSEATQNRITRIYQQSGIDYRYSCLEDYGLEPDQFRFFANNPYLQPAPSTRDRNQQYQIWAKAIATSAAQQALEKAGLKPETITHLIVVSCTGFSAPGVDIHLIQSLGLPAMVARTLVGFMGCHGALNGLKLAHAICQGDDQAQVLLVCVELCSLHFQINDSVENLVINAIFADGAAAAILRSQSYSEAVGKLIYQDSYSQLLAGEDLMNWTIGDTGFLMGLSPKVPEVIAEYLPHFLHDFLAKHQLNPAMIDGWAIHPGGRKIVETIQDLLALSDSLVHDSFEVLRLYGNMSSPTILFILQRLLARHHRGLTAGNGFNHLVGLAFGPGLTIESCLWQQLGANA
ncbi:type III polyketide synthase [Synechocystis sp. LKSZ1]|uniref:type III polyketide synthase n=1 Tax=Synechocystis sp. LKSZ1 TaxID=3144951 RepID=UPI00336BD2DF